MGAKSRLNWQVGIEFDKEGKVVAVGEKKQPKSNKEKRWLKDTNKTTNH